MPKYNVGVSYIQWMNAVITVDADDDDDAASRAWEIALKGNLDFEEGDTEPLELSWVELAEPE